MKLEYQAIMWLFMLLLPIIAFTVYGIVSNISFADTVSSSEIWNKIRQLHGFVNNGYGFAMIIVEALWCIGISFIMFNDETQTTLINNEEITKMV